MGSLYRRGNKGPYWASITVTDKVTGIKRRYQRSTETEDVKVARVLLGKWEAAAHEGKFFDIAEQPQPHTWEELIEQYKRFIAHQKSAKWKGYVLNQLSTVFGGKMLPEITLKAVQEYQSALLAKGRKPATVDGYVAVLMHMLKCAEDWNMLTETQYKKAKLHKVKLFREDNTRLRFLSRDELAVFVDACDDELRPIVIFAANTGVRKQQVLRLRWEHVDLKHGLIRLPTTKSGKRLELPMNKTVRTLLQGLVRPISGEGWVFPSPDTGKPFVDVKKAWARACKKAGLHDFTFHDLRHTFASQLVMAGVDLTTVKELLGHKDIKMTLRYAHLAPVHKQKAVEMLDNLSLKKAASM